VKERSPLRDGRVDGGSNRREELVGGGILRGVIDMTTILASAKLEQRFEPELLHISILLVL
jgi:hypothetical protein